LCHLISRQLPEKNKKSGLTTLAGGISAGFSVPAMQGRGLSNPRVLAAARGSF